MPTVTFDWWGKRSNVADLYRWLADQGRIDASDIGDLIEKPHKWTPEYREFQAAENDAPTAA